MRRIQRPGCPSALAFPTLTTNFRPDDSGTGDLGINSAYYQIYYLPIVTAAIYFGPIATILWTTLASLAYASFLIPALQEYELTAEGATTLATRLLFFFLAAILVNRFVIAGTKQVQRLQTLSETLEQTNLQLRRAEADARRSERLAALGQLAAGLPMKFAIRWGSSRVPRKCWQPS